MPFALIIVGILLIIVGIKNRASDLGSLLVSAFSGPSNFFYWIAALLIIGLLGEIDELQKPSRMFIVLVLLAMLLRNPGFPAKFVQQLQAGSSTQAATTPPPSAPMSPAAQAGQYPGPVGWLAQQLGSLLGVGGN